MATRSTPSSAAARDELALAALETLLQMTKMSNVDERVLRALCRATAVWPRSELEGAVSAHASADERRLLLQQLLSHTPLNLSADATVVAHTAPLVALGAQLTIFFEGTLHDLNALAAAVDASGAPFAYRIVLERCTDLKGHAEVELPARVVAIAHGAFAVKEDEDEDFHDRFDALTHLAVPGSVETIGAVAFEGCVNLRTLALAKGLVAIGARAFIDCTSLEDVEVPSTVARLGSRAFAGCAALERVVLPGSIARIGNHAFARCARLRMLELSAGLVDIGGSAFAGCASLEHVEFPATLACIGRGAFSKCTSLATLVLPDALQTIGDGAFQGCSALARVTWPTGPLFIGKDAFAGCTLVVVPDTLDVRRDPRARR